MPVKLGGLGLRAPSRVQYAARLASLVSSQEYALQLGASDIVLALQLGRAKRLYERQLGASLGTALKPGKDLQQALTEPLHRMVLDEVRGSGADQLERLNSLTNPPCHRMDYQQRAHLPTQCGRISLRPEVDNGDSISTHHLQMSRLLKSCR